MRKKCAKIIPQNVKLNLILCSKVPANNKFVLFFFNKGNGLKTLMFNYTAKSDKNNVEEQRSQEGEEKYTLKVVAV